MSPPDTTKPHRGRLLGIVRIVLGLAILAFVATHLPWRDEVSWRGPGVDELLVATGTIRGDWKKDAVEFLAPPEELVDPRWPTDLATAARSGQALALTRRAAKKDAVGYDWKPGMPRVFHEMELSGIVAGMALISLGTLFAVTRWWRLLALAGCRTRWRHALRLTFIGYFYNLVVPGLTGGDIVKGVIAAKENPGRRADAVVSVVVDRLIGLGALALLAMAVILFSGEAFADLRLPLLGFLGLGVAGVVLYANPTLRKALHLSELADRLPLGDKLRSLDQAATIYLRHPFEMAGAVALSLGNHLCVVFGVYALGLAFGVDAVSAGTSAVVGIREFLVVVPVANIVSAVPVTPGGWGLGEYVYKGLFEMIGAGGTLGVAVSVTFRLSQVVLGLGGGVFMLLPRGKAEVREAKAEQDLP